jgi:hypothetical protein
MKQPASERSRTCGACTQNQTTTCERVFEYAHAINFLEGPSGSLWPDGVLVNLGWTELRVNRFQAVVLGANVLPHHSRILMFEDVTVIHEGMRPRRGMIEGNQKLGLVLDKNHVLPTRQMSRRRRALK